MSRRSSVKTAFVQVGHCTFSSSLLSASTFAIPPCHLMYMHAVSKLNWKESHMLMEHTWYRSLFLHQPEHLALGYSGLDQ